ncbi:MULTISPECIES: hypothetical protein [unclassified Streptomyces]|uniref:hypothetical protein n=1 Tax=unclassified Streptomyces TaxID=2593676 RepID=UPI00379B7EBE
MTSEQTALEAAEETGRSPDERLSRSRRRRNGRVAVVTGGVAGGVVSGFVVSSAVDGSGGARRAQGRSKDALPAAGVAARPEQSPPRALISAGKIADSEYCTSRSVTQPNGDGSVEFEWSLLDSATGTYERSDRACVDDDALIAWRGDPQRCDPGRGEFRNKLVLVSLDGKRVTPPSGFRKAGLRYSIRGTPISTKR